MRVWIIDKGWYLLWWSLAFLAARLWLVNPIVEAVRELKK